MNYFFIIIAGTLGGLAILALVKWFPRHLEREEAIWQAEWLQLSERSLPPAEPRLRSSKLQLTFEALVVICLGIVVAASFAGGAGWSLQVGFSILFGWSLIALAMIDARIRLLPDKIIFPMLWLGLLIQTIPDPANIGLERAVWGTAAGYLLLWVPAQLFQLLRNVEAVGHGDFKLMALIGAWMGPDSLLWTLLAGSTAAVIYYLARGGSRHTEFPFGPWLIAAALGQIVFTAVYR